MFQEGIQRSLNKNHYGIKIFRQNFTKYVSLQAHRCPSGVKIYILLPDLEYGAYLSSKVSC